ncbi:uroporphyrinogen decarboxylase [Reyranella sp. CPCC 100927]|uniref:uroporphyrinogen decarboxylase n=1 Tax=Reyranella sp. CPCC 100927 TaxID=2599616 RepID=UPI0011B6D247|nr:uroporphyrinogen decarboxylase [Reyranella sp. CPCC 100927]TWS95959.1 uroporphyrinogen decarboxylase [Reyranella sp. CPCC 100927]
MQGQNQVILRVLRGERVASPPIWLMRQAGRYLPEYRATRAAAGSFLDLCYAPDLATEVTLQPIRRFGFDAAIIFSDILVIPQALGRKLWFEEGEGPRLEPLTGPADIAALAPAGVEPTLQPVYQAIRQTRAALPAETALIGFCGAPFTLACYMIEGGGSRDFLKVKQWAYGHPDSFRRLIDTLVQACIDHLDLQVQAGCDAVQIFDSWAGILPEEQLFRWSVQPMQAIARGLKARHADVPVIAFPRGVGPAALMYRRLPEFAALSIDTTIGAHWAAQELQPHVAVQGNLDPAMLIAGGETMVHEVKRILGKLAGGRHVFNLGHGILPQTPPDNVARLVEIVRDWTSR